MHELDDLQSYLITHSVTTDAWSVHGVLLHNFAAWAPLYMPAALTGWHIYKRCTPRRVALGLGMILALTLLSISFYDGLAYRITVKLSFASPLI